MRRGLAFAFLAALLSCNTVQRDIFWADVGDDLKDIIYNWDRGLADYRADVRQHISTGAGRYMYKPPAHMSQYRVDRAVHGLGGTKIENAEQLAQVVDVLFHVARNDPTPLVRANALSQLGRVVARMPIPDGDEIAADPAAEERIHALAQDFFAIKVRLDKGEKVLQSDVMELMRLLSELRPPRIYTALELVRTLAVPPIARTAPGPVRDLREKIVPPLVRDAVLVVLREQACGNPVARSAPDDDPLVRARAASVLAGLRSAVALEQAVARLAGGLDPVERDVGVRVELCRYLGFVGGPRAFAACLERHADTDLSVAYHAQAALQRMTGARLPRTARQWNEFRKKRKRWQLKPDPAEKTR